MGTGPGSRPLPPAGGAAGGRRRPAAAVRGAGGAFGGVDPGAGLEQARRLPLATRRLVPVAVGLALLPLTPVPLATQERPPIPEFIRAGHWRECVEPGGVFVPVPLPTPPQPQPMRWATAAGAEFALPEGFFIGPYGENGRAAMGISPARPTVTKYTTER